MKDWIIFLLIVAAVIFVIGIFISWIIPGIDIKKKEQKGKSPK
jgi:hypothetical protein